MTDTLQARLRDARYCGQEGMRLEAADRIDALEELLCRVRMVCAHAEEMSVAHLGRIDEEITLALAGPTSPEEPEPTLFPPTPQQQP